MSEAHCFWGSDFQFHRNETKKIVESGVVKNTLGKWCFLMSALCFRTPLVGDFYAFFVKPPWKNNETGIVWSNLKLVYRGVRCKYPPHSLIPPWLTTDFQNLISWILTTPLLQTFFLQRFNLPPLVTKNQKNQEWVGINSELHGRYLILIAVYVSDFASVWAL